MTWKRFYDTHSFIDKGTLYQLRNAINRANVSAAAEDDYNASDDFFVLVARCHIVAAAMQYLSMKEVSDMPSHPQLTEDLWLRSESERKDILQGITMEVVLLYANFEVQFRNPDNEAVDDRVQCYASELLTHGLMYMEFSDSIHEGDGLRILRCWRYLMLMFKATMRKNYSIEALNLLAQYHFFLSPRQAEQLIWSRCINTCGIPGRNIPSDLFMEHLNRTCKVAVANLGSNKTSAGLTRAGKCVGVLHDLLSTYDKDLGVPEHSGCHSIANMDKDKRIILKELLEANVFGYERERKHHCFAKVDNIFSSLKEKQMKDWMKEQLHTLRNKFF